VTTTAAPRPAVSAPSTDGRGAGDPTRPLAETGLLVRLVLRRDRVRLVLWVVGIAALVVVSAGSVAGLYDTPESLAGYASLAEDNAAVVVQAGPGYGLDEPTTGAVLMNEASIWTIIMVALMSILMVVRHTRAEEESERAELLRSGPVGRHAAAASAMIGVALADVAVAIAVVTGLLALGFDATGSVAFGSALAGAGLVFGAVGLVAAQVATSSRAASGLGILALGIAFVIRAVGDVAENGLSWLSPIGWGQGIRAFADERWWVLVLPVVATAALVGLAAVLAGRRDFGGGLLVPRAGPAEAGPALSGPLGLAVRLHRASIAGWAAGVAVLGAFYGIFADQAERMLEENPDMEEFFTQLGMGSITDAFLATSILMLGLLAAGFTIAAVLRIRTEESAGRADPLLATPTSRAAWAGAHLVTVGVGTVLVLAVGGLGSGVGAGVVLGEPGRVVELVWASLVMAPAPLVLGAVAFALVGARPRWSLVAWVGLVVAGVVGLFAEVLDLPGWARNLSPFRHVPALPAAPFSALPVVALLGVAAVLLAVGLAGLRHRDLNRT
jgi:ABC-2 type transport system permease protein